MHIKITIDTAEPLTPLDHRLLAALAGEEVKVVEKPAEPEKPAPRRGRAAAKAAQAPVEPVQEVEEPKAATPDPEESTDVQEASEAAEPTLDDAVALATRLMAAGKAKQVKEVLKGLGVSRVSEIPDDKISEFISALEG